MFKSHSIHVLVLLVLVLAFASPAYALEPQLGIFSGTGEPGASDGERAEASFFAPYGLARDAAGNLLVADSYNNLIRLARDGKSIETIAGTSEDADSFGFPLGGLLDGDGAKARFARPRGLAVNSKGEIFVADTNNHVVRKITGGSVVTFAGNGRPGFHDGTAPQAQFNSPSDIAIDQEDNLYVADILNNAIRKITPRGQVTLFAGSSGGKQGYRDGNVQEALFNEPSALDMDANGVLYILDCGNQLLRKIDQGMVETVAGTRGTLISETQYHKGDYRNGPGPAAAFNFPKGLDVTEEGVIFIADTWNNRVRALTPEGRVVTVVGTGISGKKGGSIYTAELGSPVDVLYSDKKLYITDAENHLIWQLPVDPENLTERPDFDLTEKSVQIFFRGEKLSYQEEGQNPYITNGKTMIPLRLVAEKLGAEVDYRQQSVKVTKGNWQKEFTYNSDTLVLKNGITMIHLRYFAESFGLNVDWVADYNAVVIPNL
jgi:hypothetical protein